MHVSLSLRFSEQIRGRMLFSKGKISKDDQVARQFSWKSAHMVSERPYFRVSVGSCFFSPVAFGGSVGSRLGQRASKSACLTVPPLFRADSGITKWLVRSVGRVLAW